jgi:drug/metabolite transporter (DMT)-like permease
VGEIFALLTALFFAVSVILFKRSVGTVSPFALNLFKNCVALPLLLITAITIQPLRNISIPLNDLLVIFVSGMLGVGISDTLFFIALNRLGASRTALIDCLYSPFVILFSVVMLDELIPAVTILGGTLIIGSVVVSSKRSFDMAISRTQFWAGCLSGAGAMATVSFAIVMVKPVLGPYPLIWVATIRLAGGLAILLLLLAFQRDRKMVHRAFKPSAEWKWMVGGTFFGTYLSLITWLGGFKYSQAGRVALLNQTSTVFIVLFAAIFLKERLTPVKLFAVSMAFTGAAIILS